MEKLRRPPCPLRRGRKWLGGAEPPTGVAQGTDPDVSEALNSQSPSVEWEYSLIRGLLC